MEKLLGKISIIWGNTWKFLVIIVFTSLFTLVFGQENIWVGISFTIGLPMFPLVDFKVKRAPMALSIALLYTIIGIVSVLSVLNIWIGTVLNFLLILLILLVSTEPTKYKPYISFIICYIFCQANPVYGKDMVLRVISLSVGGILTAVVTFVGWKIKKYGEDGKSLRQHIKLCKKNRSFILRMAIGLTLAMFIGSLLHLKKPLWITIVIMSLTQVEYKDTLIRVKNRVLGTILGIILFCIVFKFLVPEQYTSLLLLLIGYLNFYAKEYKYQQIIVAISALSASVSFLDTPIAILNRVLCLVIGIIIVCTLLYTSKFIKLILNKNQIIDN